MTTKHKSGRVIILRVNWCICGLRIRTSNEAHNRGPQHKSRMREALLSYRNEGK